VRIAGERVGTRSAAAVMNDPFTSSDEVKGSFMTSGLPSPRSSAEHLALPELADLVGELAVHHPEPRPALAGSGKVRSARPT
ncbi:hypothetical protein AB0C38_48525, partial [Amycolatopsis sp. NPDC048633]|uniref:hypothetical protein n=1 Tax=Amycolatopsis sp. NPDC048633 TaxID=3157095 RepID=UPI0033D0AAEC